ncbi:MAG: hypothetical protein A4E44_00077 [Methanosaeta sp. PtaB.Bin018]|nr:MAG: hypothetical protein A4E44_00077 [Methanosaeta sp. PtaB.Bin018]
MMKMATIRISNLQSQYLRSLGRLYVFITKMATSKRLRMMIVKSIAFPRGVWKSIM